MFRACIDDARERGLSAALTRVIGYAFVQSDEQLIKLYPRRTHSLKWYRYMRPFEFAWRGLKYAKRAAFGNSR